MFWYKPRRPCSQWLLLSSLVTVVPTVSVAAESDTLQTLENVATIAHDIVEGLWPEDMDIPGLRARIGVGLINTPDYNGSSDNKWSVVPILRLQYKDLITFTGQKLKISAYNEGGWNVGGFIRYRFGRNEDKNPVLAGLGNVGDSIDIGPFAQYRYGHVKFNVEVRQSIMNHHGTSVYAETSVGLLQTERWRALALGSLLWGSKSYNRTNFGITPEQAAQSLYGLPAYRPGSGLVETRFTIGAEYSLTEHVKVGPFISYGWLLDDAARSPIVQEGSKGQFSAGGGIIFIF
jgi:outer membrane protein